MKNMDRYCAPVKALMISTASALLMAATASPAAAQQDVQWRTIVGIIQAGNVVGNIAGGGQPWTTLGGHASVDLSSSRVQFEVRGLVLAGGNTIGTPDTVLVPLSPRGDAEFSGAIAPVPTTCTPYNVAFLIRIAAGRWIANGAV